MKSILLATAFLFFSFNYAATMPAAAELQGQVVDAATGLPVSNAYVYSVKGEEEAITDKKGAFKIISWQALPLTLTAQHKAYSETRLRVSDASKPILVKLQGK